MSNHRIAAIAAMLAITVALVFFIAAMVSGLSTRGARDTASSVHDTPHVRYAMNYAIDHHLYSFYQDQQGGTPVTVSRADTP